MHISAQTKFRVVLPEVEKAKLIQLTRKGTTSARTITRARILLMVDEGKKDKEIYQFLRIGNSTPHDIRKKYQQGGLQNALYDLPRPGKERKLTGFQEAEVVAIACSDAPKGYVRWTLDLLTEEVKKKIGVSLGRTAIWKVLLRNHLKPWLKKNVVYSESNA